MGHEATTRLDRADAGLQTQFSPSRQVGSPALECPLRNPGKRYWHVGLRVGVQQYGINGRKLALELPAKPNAAMKDPKCAELFHKMKGSAFQPTASSDLVRKADKLYPVGGSPDSPGRLEADLVCATQLVSEPRPPTDDPDVYQQGGAAGDLNKVLGQALALHLSRTMTFKVKDTGNFDVADLARVNAMAPTEMMGVKLFVFLHAKVDQKKLRYFEVVNGVLDKEIAEKDMRAKMRLDAKDHADNEGGAMPFIPGVYQVHALLRAGGEGEFTLAELHCDGDPIFP